MPQSPQNESSKQMIPTTPKKMNPTTPKKMIPTTPKKMNESAVSPFVAHIRQRLPLKDYVVSGENSPQQRLFHTLIGVCKNNPRPCLLEIALLMMTGLKMWRLTPGLELYCLKVILDTKQEKLVELKNLCQLCLVNQVHGTIPKVLSSYFLKELSSEMPELKALLSILCSFGTEEYYQKHYKEVLTLNRNGFLLESTPLVWTILRRGIKIDDDEHVDHLLKVITKTDIVSGEKKTVIFRGIIQAMEMDGSTVSGMFSPLCHSTNYNLEQVDHLNNFVSTKLWIDNISKSDDHPFTQTVLEQQFRIMSQGELIFNSKDILFDLVYVEGIIFESIQILHKLCDQHPVLVSNVYTNCLKKFFNLLCDNLSNPKSSYFKRVQGGSEFGVLFVGLIDFFIYHASTKAFYATKEIHKFFKDHFLQCYQQTLFPIEFLSMLIKNRSSPDAKVIFEDFYPYLFLLLSNYPHHIFNEFNLLLPLLISPKSYLDIFHRIIDLTVLSHAVVQNSSKNSPVISTILKMVLDNSPGSEELFWNQENSGEIFYKFLKAVETHSVTRRQRSLMHYTPLLLETFFGVMLASADENHLCTLMHSLSQRLHSIFPGIDNVYTNHISQMMLNNAVLIFRKFPRLIVDLEGLVLELLTEHEGDQVFSSLCFILGHCLSSCEDEILNFDLIVKFYETLETLMYERLVQLRLKYEPKSRIPSSIVQSFDIMISTLSKTAGRCPDLIPRVIVSLSQFPKYHDILPESVVQTAIERIRLLRFPSIASSILCPKYFNSANDTSSTGNVATHTIKPSRQMMKNVSRQSLKDNLIDTQGDKTLFHLNISSHLTL